MIFKSLLVIIIWNVVGNFIQVIAFDRINMRKTFTNVAKHQTIWSV